MPPEPQDRPERSSGVKLVRIIPIKVAFDVNPSPDPKITSATVNVALQSMISTDQKSLFLTVGVKVAHAENGPYQLEVVFAGEYQKEEGAEINWDWDKFSRANGAAIIFPYVREMVTNLTARIGAPLFLPPINIAALAASEPTPKK